MPPAVLRLLRPGLQVPLANACAFAGIAALVMHGMRTAALSDDAFPAGVGVVGLASLVVMRLLFGRARDAHGARMHALFWPPVLGGAAGAVVHVTTCNPRVGLSIAGVWLGGGVPEIVAVASLSAFAGLLGAAVLVPQVLVIARARGEDCGGGEGGEAGHAGARLARLADRLARATWGLACVLAGAAYVVARPGEIATASALAAVTVAGLAAQIARAGLGRAGPASVPAAPYR
jgi:hypothetical protein